MGSFAGNMGMYIAEMFEDAWQLYGMAECGMIPAFFGKRSEQFGTPINSVLFSYVIICILQLFKFGDNLAINNFFSCASCVLELLSFLKLRWDKPDNQLTRPYKVPLSNRAALAALVIPLTLGLVVIGSGFFRSVASA